MALRWQERALLFQVHSPEYMFVLTFPPVRGPATFLTLAHLVLPNPLTRPFGARVALLKVVEELQCFFKARLKEGSPCLRCGHSPKLQSGAQLAMS